MSQLIEKCKIVCTKCGGSHFQINWKFETESDIIVATMCHRGFGLELNGCEIICVRCGNEGHYTEKSKFKISCSQQRTGGL